jgi:hypothetical protein
MVPVSIKKFKKSFVDAGTVIVMGPILDPAGSWSLAVVEAGSENEIRSIIARDPAVISGRGVPARDLPGHRIFLSESVSCNFLFRELSGNCFTG